MKAVINLLRVQLEPAGGLAAGWQLLNPHSGEVIEEGPWGMEAGESPVPLPAADGDYRLLVSQVSPDHGWAYDRGEKLRVIGLAVRSGVMSIVHDRRTTLRALRLARLPHRVVALAIEPWKILWQNRSLMGAMVKRDLMSRYRGSFGDISWAVLQPLLLMLTYWVVFGLVLQTRCSPKATPAPYVQFFLCGMMPCLAFNASLPP